MNRTSSLNMVHNHAADRPCSPADSQVLYLCYAPKLWFFALNQHPGTASGGSSLWRLVPADSLGDIAARLDPLPFLVPRYSPSLLHSPLQTFTPHTNMSWGLCCKTTALREHDTALPTLLMFGTEETRER